MSHRLPDLPPGIRLLTDVEASRLREHHPTLPRSPEQCITCEGAKQFRWYADGEVVTYTCDCRNQWLLHRYLLHSGVGTHYQQIGWGDVQAEPGAREKVDEYIEYAGGYIKAGIGLILYGSMGSGKTMLSILLLKHLLASGHDGYATTFSEMLETFRAGWRDPEEKRWFYRRVKNAGVLVVDDVGRELKQRRNVAGEGLVENTTSTAVSTFDEVIRHRLANSQPTIITTNLDLDSIKGQYGSNILSLLSERSSTYQFTGADFRHIARARHVEEVQAGLTRPVVIG